MDNDTYDNMKREILSLINANEEALQALDHLGTPKWYNVKLNKLKAHYLGRKKSLNDVWKVLLDSDPTKEQDHD